MHDYLHIVWVDSRVCNYLDTLIKDSWDMVFGLKVCRNCLTELGRGELGRFLDIALENLRSGWR